MEFDRLINVFTISAILVMMFASFVSAGFAVKERAERNLGYTKSVCVFVNRTIN